ncbi:MAG: tripartite tricarboxylate transporter TctB family protein [Chloroflexi bacterium]|nr:tripartite tricarboxylate transporter TctB family protein [Chloroflexota bacterium]
MKIMMKKADQITAIVLAVFSLLVIEESAKMQLTAEFAPGYGFFPFWLGVLMLILSIMLLVDARQRPEALDEKAPFPERQGLVNVALVLAALGVYAFLMEPLGYILDTLLLTGLLLKGVEREPWKITLLVTVGMTIALYVIFQILLGVTLPKGFLGF